jgi:hypothetical protein
MQQQGRHMSATLRAQVLQLVDETNDMHADG